jgi:hypothetical protein
MLMPSTFTPALEADMTELTTHPRVDDALRHNREFAAGHDVSGFVHHTDCGITRILDQKEALASEFGVTPDQLDTNELRDPRRTLAADVSRLQANPFLPRNLAIGNAR